MWLKLLNATVSFLFLGMTALPSCKKDSNDKQQPPAKAPNIVFILVDDQGWAGTSVKMDPSIERSANNFFQTPNLEALAKTGIVFANGYASHCNCSPSRASILTGKSPAQLGMTDVINRKEGRPFHGNQYDPPPLIKNLPLSNTILPKWIKEHRPEYMSALFGKWHVSVNGGPETYGFDYAADTINSHNGTFNNDPKHTFSITADGIKWMQTQVQQNRPFYLQLCYHAVHLPMETMQSTFNKVNSWPDAAMYNNDVKMMAAMTLDLDSAIGMVINKLKELGIENNTYIIYSSDNGLYPTSSPVNLNGPLHGWKSTLWQGGLKVPYIIAGPGISPGYSSTPIMGYDIFPTVCDWLGITQLPSGVEGGSIAKTLRNRGAGLVQRPNDFLAFYFPHYQFNYGAQPSAAIIQGDYKLIKFYEGNVLRLYDLKTDMEEVNDLSNTYPDRTAQMNNFLDIYLKNEGAQLPVKNPDYDPATDPGKAFWDTKQKLMTTPYFVIHE